GVGARPWRERKPYGIACRATHPVAPRKIWVVEHLSGSGGGESCGLHHIPSAQPHPSRRGRAEHLPCSPAPCPLPPAPLPPLPRPKPTQTESPAPTATA
ncbi:MAG: hypothetical protein IPL28_23420, partial [Chloroflexi bacterium]|nr:hypothetical protein [Chloroflexota bacterium]